MFVLPAMAGRNICVQICARCSLKNGCYLKSGQTEKVRAELSLTHKGIDYTIVSELTYKKTERADKPVVSVGQRTFTIMYKQNGQVEYVTDILREGKMKEILPSELARYFFFDGERITVMSKRLSQGKGDEFARAVQSLLGLDAFTAAIGHLGKAVKDYEKKYDSHSDSRIDEYNRQIIQLENEIERIEKRLADIEREEIPVEDKINELQLQIEKNRASAELAERKKKLIARRDSIIVQKARNVGSLLMTFKRAPAYFAKKLMHDSLQQLKDSHKSEKSVPSVNAKTIKHIIERGRCICGSDVCTGNDAFIALTDLLNYIPPKSIGDSIADFRDKCKEKVRNSEMMYAEFEGKYSDICGAESDYNETLEEISQIEQALLGMADVNKLQADLMRYQKQQRDLHGEKIKLSGDKRVKETDRDRKKTDRDTLALKDENNRRIMTYKAYAQYMLDTLKTTYAEEEQKIRKKLERTVNDIFHNILGEGFTLSVSEKYDVQVALNEYGGSSETSTAQNISIIFAFIAGVIQMARDSQNEDGGLLVSEPYPLVMDAPLSAFDKTRIQNVCDVLPKIAEQVIIFIKDADGEIAEEHLGSRIGNRLSFNAVSKVETYVQ
jgi:DNA sulfur modification protein DndD